MEENKRKELIDLGEVEELLDDIDKMPPIEIDLESYDQEQFFKGIEDSSYLCGKITAMLNAGCSEDFVLTYLLNKETIEHNLDTLKLSNQAQIEISKNQKVLLEKQEL